MSKSFEQEYRNLAQSELPDLWDRIEAGLTRKAVTEPDTPADMVKNDASVQAAAVKESPVIQVVADRSGKKNAVISFFRRYETAAAALLCVVILVPAFLVMRQIGMGGVKSESAMPAEEYAAADTMREEAESAEAPATMADVEFEVTEEASAEEASVMEDAAAEESAEMIPETKTEIMAEAKEESRSEALSEENMQNSMKESIVSDESSEGTIKVLTQVGVEITEVIDVTGEGAKEVLGGNLYRCLVTDANQCGEIADFDEIIILVPDTYDEKFMFGEHALFDLADSAYMSYDYEVVCIYD